MLFAKGLMYQLRFECIKWRLQIIHVNCFEAVKIGSHVRNSYGEWALSKSNVLASGRGYDNLIFN